MALLLLQGPGAGQERLEPVLVFFDSPGAPALREFEERRGAQRRPKAQLEQILEVIPPRHALVFTELVVPHLSHILQIVRGHQTFSSSMIRCWWK